MSTEHNTPARTLRGTTDHRGTAVRSRTKENSGCAGSLNGRGGGAEVCYCRWSIGAPQSRDRSATTGRRTELLPIPERSTFAPNIICCFFIKPGLQETLHAIFPCQITI